MTNQTVTEQTDELTVNDVIGIMDKHYDLIFIDYNENLDEQPLVIQTAIQNQDWCALDELLEECNFWENQWDSACYVIDSLKQEIGNTWNITEEEIDEFFEDEYNREKIKDEIYERDSSTPLKDLLRNTDDPVMFYDTGESTAEEGCGDDEIHAENLETLKTVLGIKDDKYDKQLEELLINSYGGSIVIYFRESVKNMMTISENGYNTVTFKNPAIAIIDTYNGSGYDTEFPGLEVTLPLNTKNIFVDKTIKYNYTFSVCGMSASWCDCTTIKFSKTEIEDNTNVSSLHAELEQEEKYNKTFKEGKCTFGDMDINRHKHTVYINNFPCGLHCTVCNTFWID